jgi:O-antigen ligase
MIGLRTKNWSILFVLLIPLALLFVPGVTDFFNSSKVYGADRFTIWQDAVNIWQSNPIFGAGAGNYQFFDRIYGLDKVGVAHNQYLEVLAEMGIQGLVSLLWLLCAMSWVAWRSFTRARTALSKSIALAYIGCQLTLFISGFFTDLFMPSAAAGGGTSLFVESSYRWILLGIVLSIPNWEQEAERQEEQSKLQEAGVEQAKEEIVGITGQ